jgi:hypothetical protein
LGASRTAQASLIEITKADLFSLKDWDSTRVSVLGFRLGMTKNEALRNAEQQGLTLDDESGQGCMDAASCNAYRDAYYIGLVLTFGPRKAIQRIRVELPWDLSQEEREMCLVNEFSGKTKELFLHYSDNLRIRLLGLADDNWFSVPNVGSPSWAWVEPLHQEYRYDSKGLILHVHLKNPGSNDTPLVPKVVGDFTFPR